MANDTSRKPWFLDTAAVITTDRIRVRALRWVDGTTAGHTCLIEDSNGEQIWQSHANGDNFIDGQDYGREGKDFQGFELSAIDSGNLYVDLA